MAEIIEIAPKDLKRGMVLAEDVVLGGKIVGDAGSLLSGTLIAILRKLNLQSVKISVTPKPAEDLPQLESPDISNLVEKINHAVMLYDDEIDDPLKIKRLIKNLSTAKDPGIIEAADFVLNFYEDVRARELAVESLESIYEPWAVNTLLMALRDESNTVRAIAQRLILVYMEERTVRELLQIIEVCGDDTIKKEIFDLFPRVQYEKLSPVLESLKKSLDEGSRLRGHLEIVIQMVTPVEE